MRAKFELKSVYTEENKRDGGEILQFSAVTEKPFDEHGKNDDNDFARWTPNGELTMTVTNPNLWGKFSVGEKYYLDFTKVEN